MMETLLGRVLASLGSSLSFTPGRLLLGHTPCDLLPLRMRQVECTNKTKQKGKTRDL